MRGRTLFWLLMIGLVLSYPAALAALSETIAVDCTDPDPKKHGSITKALESKADQLTIEISGFCNERVVVTRHNVTLIGAGPASDGITGPALDDILVQRALVRVVDARGVRFENLTITSSESRGLEGVNSFVEVVNCRVVENDGRGIQADIGGLMEVEDTLIADNGGQELITFIGGFLRCTRCTVEDDAGVVALPVRGSVIILIDSTVSTGGAVAVIPVERATVFATDTNVSAGLVALYAEQDAEIQWNGGEVEGSIWADFYSKLVLDDITQTANPAGNLAADGSHVRITGGTFVGDTHFTTFSNGSAQGSPTFDTLSCDAGGDFYCDASETKASSSCGLCP